MAYLDTKMLFYPAQVAQIALIIIKKITILTKYLNFINIFSKKIVMKPFKHFNINKHLMDLKPDKKTTLQINLQPKTGGAQNPQDLQPKIYKMGDS